jgi:hypothetical protein
VKPHSETVGVLEEGAVQEAVDILLRANCIPSNSLMSILVKSGWTPSSETSTIVLAFALFVKPYNSARDDMEYDIMASLEYAQGQTLSHPSVSNLVAANAGAAIDKAVGV